MTGTLGHAEALVAGRPLPEPDHVSSAYWQAAAEGRLLYQECVVCGQRQFYPRAMCTECSAVPEWREASGHGSVHTFTIIRQNWAPPFADHLPYVVAMIELDEGPRMMSNVIECDPEGIRIGMPVEVVFAVAAEGVGLPFWRPRSDGAR